MYLNKARKNGFRFIALAVIVMMVAGFTIGCGSAPAADNKAAADTKAATQAETQKDAPKQEATAKESGLHKLTQKEVMDMYIPTAAGMYQDKTMKEAIKAAGPKDIELTEEETQKIKSMNLKIAVETNHMDDAFKMQLGGLKETCAKYNITMKDVWMAADTSSTAQLEDYQKIESVAQNYDGILTLPMDVAASSEILKQIMKKTTVTTLCSAPYGVDWNDPHFGGIADSDGYLAGVYSAKAAIKILNGTGKLGAVGFVGGREGSFHTVQERYRGWNDVFKENPDVKVVQQWFDDPSKAGEVVSSMLAANPDIKTLLIDWANPPANQAETVFKQRGLKPWKDISMVTIDLDNTVVVPMALGGPDNNYTGAFATQTWYNVGKLWGQIYAKSMVTGGKSPKFVVSPPLPLTVFENLKTSYTKAVPKDYPIPPEVMKMENQWPLGVEDIWK